MEIKQAELQRIFQRIGDAMQTGTDDDACPIKAMQAMSQDMIIAIAAGMIDPVEIAQEELVLRGFDLKGSWMGDWRRPCGKAGNF